MSRGFLSVEYLKERAQQAMKRISGEVYKTPLIRSNTYGSNLYFKGENFQFSGSFKLRGAFSKLTMLRDSDNLSSTRLITASSGNHGLACSYAAKELGGNLTVVLPETVAPVKLEKINSFGVNVILHGSESGEAENYAQNLSKSEGYYYVSPYNDLDIIAGQGTISLELIESLGPNEIDNVFISMGGGGLISGISAVLKAFNPSIKIWGVSAKNSCTLADSLKIGKIIETQHLPTLADGVSGGIDNNTITFDICRNTVDDLLWCDEAQIKESFLDYTYKENQLVEGSAALALAGYKQVCQEISDQTSVVISCGANVDKTMVKKLLL